LISVNPSYYRLKSENKNSLKEIFMNSIVPGPLARGFYYRKTDKFSVIERIIESEEKKEVEAPIKVRRNTTTLSANEMSSIKIYNVYTDPDFAQSIGLDKINKLRQEYNDAITTNNLKEIKEVMKNYIKWFDDNYKNAPQIADIYEKHNDIDGKKIPGTHGTANFIFATP
jgi:hypothetical protein